MEREFTKDLGSLAAEFTAGVENLIFNTEVFRLKAKRTILHTNTK